MHSGHGCAAAPYHSCNTVSNSVTALVKAISALVKVCKVMFHWKPGRALRGSGLPSKKGCAVYAQTLVYNSSSGCGGGSSSIAAQVE